MNKSSRTEEKNSEKPQGKKQRPAAVYKLTGMGIKMAVVILLGVYLGGKADAAGSSEIPWFTLIGSLAGVAAAIYFVIKDVRDL